MASEELHVDSRAWTGEIPQPRKRVVRPFQAKLLFVLCIFAVPDAVAKIADGFLSNRIRMPLVKYGGFVPASNRLGFWTCVVGWLWIALCCSIAGFGSVLWVRKNRGS